MARYIDADKLSSKVLDVWKKFEKQGKNCYIFADIFVPLIVSTPTEDVEQIVHGEWLAEQEYTARNCRNYKYYKCSVCGRKILISDNPSKYFQYCHCGAKMSEQKESEDKE